GAIVSIKSTASLRPRAAGEKRAGRPARETGGTGRNAHGELASRIKVSLHPARTPGPCRMPNVERLTKVDGGMTDWGRDSGFVLRRCCPALRLTPARARGTMGGSRSRRPLLTRTDP